MESFWGQVELMGHVRHIGLVSEEERFGGKIGRIDTPRSDGSFSTTFFAASAVYRITVLTEADAKALAGRGSVAISPWDFPRVIAQGQPNLEQSEHCDDDNPF